MNPMNTELQVFTFNTPTGADSMLETLKGLQDDDLIELLDAVVVTKDSNNKVEVRQPLEVGPGKGAAFGALTGAVVGLLGGPAGVIVGFVSGAVTGGAAGAAMKSGLPEADIEALADDELDPGDSALLVYVDDVWVDQVEQAAEDFGAAVYRQILADQRKTEREQRTAVRKEKIDAASKSWQARIDKQRAAVASLRQQVSDTHQANRDAVQKQIAEANARLDQTYQNIVHRLQVWQQQLDAEISALEAQIKQSNASAKADLDQRLASAKQSRQALRSKVKETLSSRLNYLKSETETLKAQADHAQGQAKDKLNQRIAKLQADVAVEEQRLDQMQQADDAAWDAMAASIDTAIDNYWAALDEAEELYESEYDY
jgi:uncharacterized membrane protein